MSKPSRKLKTAIVVIVATLLAAAIVVAPLILDLYRINKVIDEFRLDNAVNDAVFNNRRVSKVTAEYFLDPPFMARYGLSAKDNEDAQGYFSPTGIHWSKWSLETKTAAILMWQGTTNLSARKIHHTIRLVDDYYSRNEKTTPVGYVVGAVKKL